MSDDRSKPDLKNNAPGGFFFFMMMILMGVLLLQNMIQSRMAPISFSYQVEHLVNLELVRPEDSRKTAQNDNLVTFSGRFKESLPEDSRQRFRYLELLAKKHLLNNQKEELLEKIAASKQAALRAGDWFLHLSGQPIPEGGYRVIEGFYDTYERENKIVVKDLSKRNIPSLPEMQARFKKLQTTHDADNLYNFRHALKQWLSNFNSSALGLASEPHKQMLRKAMSELDSLPETSKVDLYISSYQKIFTQLKNMIAELDEWSDSSRLSKLRSVRDYKERILTLNAIEQDITQNTAQLDKAKLATQNVIWFFNNQELSSRTLEKQDPEIYNQWFTKAKEIWENFSIYKGAFFSAPDQPRNVVLEKTFKSEEPPPNYISYFFTLLPVLLIIGLLYFAFSRQIKGMGGGAMSFGKSPAKLLQKGTHKVTFKDVAGIEEAKEELQEIVDFLKEPERYSQIGAEIPKGILCVGPPGTGKTLIAKAVAGEADRPFFSISGSDFVEMFVGVGASRIRDMFDQARKNAPCIIFMDEIDAVGRHRGAGVGGGHDEREQTLNQLLVEMDGFDSNEGIILMAATNRPDVLDKALLRPGRFDRRVTIDLPDIKGRYEILKIHAKKIRMDDNVDLMTLARATPGSSGADLKNILNEAALLAVRNGRTAVTYEEAMEACDKVRFGTERRSLEITEQEKEKTAYHEAGHAVVAMLLEHCDPVEKITVIPRGMALGATYTLPTKNRVGYWHQELKDHLAMIMGGRCAEELFVGDTSSGVRNDLERATDIARSMVCEWGMSEVVGLRAIEERTETNQYLGGSSSMSSQHSDATFEQIDQEIKRILDEAYRYAKDLLKKHSSVVKEMADMLMRFETLDAEDAKLLLDGKFDPEEKEERLRINEEKHKDNAPKEDDKDTKEAKKPKGSSLFQEPPPATT